MLSIRFSLCHRWRTQHSKIRMAASKSKPHRYRQKKKNKTAYWKSYCSCLLRERSLTQCGNWSLVWAQLFVSIPKVKCSRKSEWGTDSAKLWKCTLSVVLLFGHFVPVLLPLPTPTPPNYIWDSVTPRRIGKGRWALSGLSNWVITFCSLIWPLFSLLYHLYSSRIFLPLHFTYYI